MICLWESDIDVFFSTLFTLTHCMTWRNPSQHVRAVLIRFNDLRYLLCKNRFFQKERKYLYFYLVLVRVYMPNRCQEKAIFGTWNFVKSWHFLDLFLLFRLKSSSRMWSITKIRPEQCQNTREKIPQSSKETSKGKCHQDDDLTDRLVQSDCLVSEPDNKGVRLVAKQAHQKVGTPVPHYEGHYAGGELKQHQLFCNASWTRSVDIFKGLFTRPWLHIVHLSRHHPSRYSLCTRTYCTTRHNRHMKWTLITVVP